MSAKEVVYPLLLPGTPFLCSAELCSLPASTPPLGHPRASVGRGREKLPKPGELTSAGTGRVVAGSSSSGTCHFAPAQEVTLSLR